MSSIFRILLVICFLQFAPVDFFGQGENKNLFSNGFSQTLSKQEKDSLVAEFTSKLLPIPKKISFPGKFFLMDEAWTIDYSNPGLQDGYAVQSLVNGLKERVGIIIKPSTKSSREFLKRSIRLIIKKGSVKIGGHIDKDIKSLEQQAYRLTLSKGQVSVTANAEPGLFYGVQTLLQLLNSGTKEALIPEGEIVDWPDMSIRMIYWDDAHHLERMEAFKWAIDNAAFYKINAFALKLDGHFLYKKAYPLVEPYAMIPSEYQALTDYARARYVELIPYLDAPAHISFILKHPAYASLRSFSNSNYEMSITNPKSYELILGMFDELIDANKGGKYIFLSTDEAYYAGMAESEKEKAKELGGNGRLLADFITKVSDHLHKKGRTVIIWGEFPLTPADVGALPSHLINGINQNSAEFGSKFKEHGIRNLIFTTAEGVEPVFPEYYKLPAEVFAQNNKMTVTDEELLQGDNSKGRVSQILQTIRTSVDAGKTDMIGVVVTGWDYSGLHPETFWLGYATGNALGWNTNTATASELMQRFYYSFYGTNAHKMDRVYQLLSYQAQFWTESSSWDTLNFRTPIIGYSKGIFQRPQPVEEQTIPYLPVPSEADLSLNKDWSLINKHRLQLARRFLSENDELTWLLHQNLRNVKCNQYNLRVLISVAGLCRNNIDMLLGLERIDSLLKLSSKIADAEPSVAIALIDEALDQAGLIYKNRNETLQSITTTWYEDWHPRIEEANGRKYLLRVDDVKDPIQDRTADMSYLIYRDLHYPLGKWAEEVAKSRNAFAKKYHLPERIYALDWTKY